MIFVESRGFSKRLAEFMDEDGYRAFQNQLIVDPTKGAVIPGCGGLRNVVFSTRSHCRPSETPPR
jgi:hypothetical protein